LGEYRISELAEKAEVTKRTIHYYVNRGLIPPPKGAGVASAYDDSHLVRLRLIKKLQERFLPLDAIRQMLLGMTDEEVTAKLDELSRGTDAGADNGTALACAELVEADGMLLREDLFSYLGTPAINGTEYIRLDIGSGIELSFPKRMLAQHGDTIRAIAEYGRKLLKER